MPPSETSETKEGQHHTNELPRETPVMPKQGQFQASKESRERHRVEQK
jgi:hypothetical protein